MNRSRLPLRFTLLWAANMAVIVALELIFGLSKYLPFMQRDMEAVYCVVGGVLAAVELTLWDHFSDKE